MINTKLLTHCGTCYIMAPEILEGKEYDYKCDLWSIGVMIYQMHFKDYPYKGTTEAFLRNIKNLGQRYLKKSDNDKLNDLIRKLLVENPKMRMTWEEYFNHSFFN